MGLKAYIAIHRKGKDNVAFGATRLWKYGSDEDAISDALRLSRTMSYKISFAGMHYGGAKAVIMENDLLLHDRQEAFKRYAEFINSLNGQFITGTDAGLQLNDLNTMASHSKFIVGLKVNPEYYTALGLYYAIESGLEHLYHSSDVKDRNFSILGLGKVGLSILDLLYPNAKKIFVAEIDANKLEYAKVKYPNIIILRPNELIKQKVDVFIPCAVGTTITKQNVNLLNCKAVIGGSNNQLEDESLGEQLSERNILYAPDFIANAGGLISVVHEYEYSTNDEIKIREKLQGIKKSLSSILLESAMTKESTVIVANRVAAEIYQLK